MDQQEQTRTTAPWIRSATCSLFTVSLHFLPSVSESQMHAWHCCRLGHLSFLIQVKEKLQQVGLESCNLIIGVDFTKSNEWTGKHCFDGRSLHHLGDAPNPYEQAIGIIGRTLSAYDEDNRIPCFGFGDTSTHDRNVFNFYRDGRACNGVSEALQRYREIAPHIRLSGIMDLWFIFVPLSLPLTDRPVDSGLGPTSLAPIIETATRIVEASRHQYHILLIIADGQVCVPFTVQMLWFKTHLLFHMTVRFEHFVMYGSSCIVLLFFFVFS